MTSKLKFNPNAKSYVPETKAPQINNFINNQPNQSFFEFKSVYPENGMEDLNQYVDKILGTALPDNSEETIVVRKTCLELSGAQKEKFPGSLAANLSKYNAALTRTKNYMISHNPDGSRYLLLTINDNIYLLDRSMRVFNATKLFASQFIQVVGNNTLIDGYILKRKEVENQTSEKSEEKKNEEEKSESITTNNTTEEVTNNKGEEEKSESSSNKTEGGNSETNYNGIHFLVVDGICIKDQTVRAFHIEPRMKNIEQALSPLLTSFKIVPKQPTTSTSTEGVEGTTVEGEKKDSVTPTNEKYNEFPPSFVVTRPEEKFVGKISLSVQQYYPASQLENMFKKHFPSFGFPRVGILFSPSNEIYKLGYNEFLLLWKPMEQITVDFKVGIVKKMNKGSMRIWYQLLKSTHGELILHDWITEKGGSKLSKLNEGQVIRCFWDPNGTTIVPPSSNEDKAKEYKGGWVMRTILNKTQPNEEWVVSKLVENIESHIGKQDLIKVVTTDKDLGDDFKLAPSRFAPKKRSFWKPGNNNNGNGSNNNNNGSNGNNNNYNGNKGYNNYNGNNYNNGNNSYNNNGNNQNGNFNHQSSPNDAPNNYSQNN